MIDPNGKFDFYMPPRGHKGHRAMERMAMGCSKRRLFKFTDELVENGGTPVIWGTKGESKTLIHNCWKKKIDFVHLDLTYLENWQDETKVRLNTFRMNINTTYKNFVSPCKGDRWFKLKMQLKTQLSSQVGGKNVLIAVPSDAMFSYFQIKKSKWLHYVQKHIRRNTDAPIVIREKPKDMKLRRTLQQDLSSAKCLVTLSSNSAVEALVRGVPVITHSAAAAAPMSIKWDQIDDPPDMSRRLRWIESLCYGQWNTMELASGRALVWTLNDYKHFRPPTLGTYF